MLGSHEGGLLCAILDPEFFPWISLISLGCGHRVTRFVFMLKRNGKNHGECFLETDAGEPGEGVVPITFADFLLAKSHKATSNFKES